MLLIPTLAAVTISLSDTTSADIRSIPGSSRTALDATTSPGAVMAVTAKRSEVDLAYHPSFGYADITRRRRFILHHAASLGYSWSAPRLRLSLDFAGSYGQVTYYQAAIVAAPPDAAAATPAAGGGDQGAAGDQGGGAATGDAAQGGAQPAGDQMQADATPQGPYYLPQASILEVVSGSVSFGMRYELSRRASLGLGIGYSVSGGIRGADTYLPLRHGPGASASLAYQISQNDGLSSSVGAGVDILPNRHARYYTLRLLETWSHQFGPLTSGTLGLGVGYLQARASANAPSTRSVNAVGTAGIGHGIKLGGGAQLGLGAGATLNTVYNPVLGSYYQSLSGGGGVTWSRKRVSLNAGIQGSHSLPFNAPNPVRSYGASAGAGYVLADPVALHLGGYWTHQVLPESALAADIDPNRWGASLSVVLTAPPLKL